MKNLAGPFLVFAFVVSSNCGCSDPQSETPSEPSTPSVVDRTIPSVDAPKTGDPDDKDVEAPTENEIEAPEDVLRRYMIAVVSGDAVEIKRFMTPHEQLDVIFRGRRELPAAEKQLVTDAIGKATISRLALGDEVVLPDGRTLTMTESQVNATHQQFIFVGEEGPPVEMVLTDGSWRVNSEPIVADWIKAQQLLNETEK